MVIDSIKITGHFGNIKSIVQVDSLDIYDPDILYALDRMSGYWVIPSINTIYFNRYYKYYINSYYSSFRNAFNKYNRNLNIDKLII